MSTRSVTAAKYVSWKERKEFSADLKQVYGAVNREAARGALDAFTERWGGKYGYAITSWENNWDVLTSYFDFPLEIRRIIYTTNVIESLNSGSGNSSNPRTCSLTTRQP